MAKVRLCVIFLVFFVNSRLVASQPTFGTALWCNMFCTDDDDSSDDSYDYGFLDLFDICAGCSSKSSEETTTTDKPAQQPVKLIIPPSTGLNLTVMSNLGGVLMNLVPWLASETAAAATTVATTAAPAATTPASGNATTAKA